MYQQNNALLDLAFQTKSAAVNTSGTQVLPYSIIPSAASGMYDPSDANALYSQLSNARVDANYQRVLGNDVNPGNSGTDLIPYGGVLNQGYNAVNWATTRAQSPIGKAASQEDYVAAFSKAANMVAEQGVDPYTVDPDYLAALEEEINNLPSQEAWDTGVFEHEALVPTYGEMDYIDDMATKSAAQDVVDLGIAMANEGYFDLPEINEGNPYVSQYLAARLQGY
jgi:hypothetical protein